VADLPPPEDLIRQLQAQEGQGPGAGASQPAPAPAGAPAGASPRAGPHAGPPPSAPRGTPPGAGSLAVAEADPTEALARYHSFETVLDLIRANRDVALLMEVEAAVRLASYRPGRIAYEPAPGAAPDLAPRLSERLSRWTGARWAVTLVSDGGAPSIAEARDAERAALEAQARAHPMVQAVFEAFPEARIASIRTPQDIVAEAGVEALPEVDEEGAPFEED